MSDEPRQRKPRFDVNGSEGHEVIARFCDRLTELDNEHKLTVEAYTNICNEANKVFKDDPMFDWWHTLVQYDPRKFPTKTGHPDYKPPTDQLPEPETPIKLDRARLVEIIREVRRLLKDGKWTQSEYDRLYPDALAAAYGDKFFLSFFDEVHFNKPGK